MSEVISKCDIKQNPETNIMQNSVTYLNKTAMILYCKQNVLQVQHILKMNK